jgi:hypothetical protein
LKQFTIGRYLNGTLFAPWTWTSPSLLAPISPPGSPLRCSLLSIWMKSGTIAFISVELTNFALVLTVSQLPCCRVLWFVHCTWLLLA